MMTLIFWITRLTIRQVEKCIIFYQWRAFVDYFYIINDINKSTNYAVTASYTG